MRLVELSRAYIFSKLILFLAGDVVLRACVSCSPEGNGCFLTEVLKGPECTCICSGELCNGLLPLPNSSWVYFKLVAGANREKRRALLQQKGWTWALGSNNLIASIFLVYSQWMFPLCFGRHSMGIFRNDLLNIKLYELQNHKKFSNYAFQNVYQGRVLSVPKVMVPKISAGSQDVFFMDFFFSELWKAHAYQEITKCNIWNNKFASVGPLTITWLCFAVPKDNWNIVFKLVLNFKDSRRNACYKIFYGTRHIRMVSELGHPVDLILGGSLCHIFPLPYLSLGSLSNSVSVFRMLVVQKHVDWLSNQR